MERSDKHNNHLGDEHSLLYLNLHDLNHSNENVYLKLPDCYSHSYECFIRTHNNFLAYGHIDFD